MDNVERWPDCAGHGLSDYRSRWSHPVLLPNALGRGFVGVKQHGRLLCHDPAKHCVAEYVHLGNRDDKRFGKPQPVCFGECIRDQGCSCLELARSFGTRSVPARYSESAQWQPQRSKVGK